MAELNNSEVQNPTAAWVAYHVPRHRLIALVAAAGTLVSLLVIWRVATLWNRQHVLRDERLALNAFLGDYESSLSRAVNRRFALLEGIHAFIMENPSDEALEARFDTFAGNLYTRATGIRAFAAAPGGVNRYVYPLKGNESVPGHDLINDPRPNVRDDVRRTMATRAIALSGPYRLRQGGMGLVARLAVYREGRFWGIVAMVLDLPVVLEESGVSPAPKQIRIAIRDWRERTFCGEAAVFTEQPIILHVPLPEGHWELGAVPTEGWRTAVLSKTKPGESVGLAAIALITLLAYLLTQRHGNLAVSAERLRKEVVDVGLRLDASEKSYDLARRLSGVGVWQRDLRTDEILWSPEIAPLFGLPAGEFGGTYEAFLECIHPDDRNTVIAAGKHLKKDSMHEYSAQYRVIHPDGSVHVMESSGGPVTDADGNPVLLLGIVQDITASMEAQGELRRARAELEERVRQRTMEYQKTIRLMAGRESRMHELKKVIGTLRQQLLDAGLEPALDDPAGDDSGPPS